MSKAQTNGIRTYYEVAGEGPAVALIHGHSADLRMWEYQVEPLVNSGYSVVRYDVRGHGRSSVPAGGYTWENYAQDLAELLDDIGVEKAHVVGSSMGGGIALQFAIEFGERVRSLMLVDSALPGFTYGEEFTARIEALVEAVRTEGPRAAFERLWLNDPLFDGIKRYPARFEMLREIVLGFPGGGYSENATPEGYQPTVSDRLGEITAPTLVCTGDFDPNLVSSREIAEALPNGELRIMENVGHGSVLQRPDLTTEIFLEFVGKHRDALR